MRIDQLTLRAAGGALLLLSLVLLLVDLTRFFEEPIHYMLLGGLGPVVRCVFAATGLLLVLAARPLGHALDPEHRRRAVAVLLGVHGAALVVFAFTTPTYSTALGERAINVVTPASAAVGELALLVASTVLPAAMIVQAARWRRAETTAPRAKGAFVAAVVSLWASLAYSLADQHTLPAPGLWQRIAFVVAWGWLAALLLRTAGGLTSGSADTRR
ncbi:MAG: hypothetical protein NTV28_06630 [Propionibacteriales bacterium]|nr:hypothetical protein [Propionibacteriales bacterium]